VLSFLESVADSNLLPALERRGTESEAISILEVALGTTGATSALSFLESAADSILLPVLETTSGAESEAISILELVLGATAGTTSALSVLGSLGGSALLLAFERTGATSAA
jgi:hypothetical protein